MTTKIFMQSRHIEYFSAYLFHSCIFGVVLSSVRKVLEPNDSLNRKLHERRKSVRKDGKDAERTKKEEKRREMQSEGID